jgi:AcrR family transcriptional regulator
MKKTRLNRDELVQRLGEHLLETGLARSSLRQLAQAAGTSDRMLLYYFPDKEALMEQVLTHLGHQLAIALDAAIPPQERLHPARLVERIAGIAAGPVLGRYMRVWTEVSAAAGEGVPPFPATADRIGTLFHAWIESRMQMPDPARATAVASLILTVVDGAALLQPIAQGQIASQACAELVRLLKDIAH